MVMFRMPIFTWNMLVTSFLVLLAFPTLTAALAMLWADRHLGAHFFDVAGGGTPVLWLNLFWFFGHPEVYILVLPYFGVVTDIIPTFSRKPIFGYKGMVFATLAIAGLSLGVWAHHMFTTGVVLLPFFSALSLLIAVPTGIKFFNWIGTMWRGQLTFEAPMLFAIGFMLLFLLGGLTGVMLAQPPIDFHVHDTYFVVAHFHYVLFGGSVFAIFAAIYYWWPKWTGKRLHEGWARIHFALLFIGFNLTFFPQHELGLRGMPRRIATYAANEHWSFLNLLSTIGAYITGIAILPFLWNVWITWRRGEREARTHGGRAPSSGRRRRRRRSTTSTRCPRSAPSGPPGTWPIPSSTPAPAAGVAGRAEAAETDTSHRGRRAMKAETRVAGLGVVFLAVIAAIYWFTSYEDAGTTLLTVCALAYLLLTSYLFVQGRRLGRPRPEDREDATIADASGIIGYFPAASVWPVGLALGVIVIALGLVFGPWFFVVGFILTVGAIVGYAVEAQARH